MTTTVLITGAASGIGWRLLRHYAAADGYRAIGMDLEAIPDCGDASRLLVDLVDERACRAAFSGIERIDLAINCAGVSSQRKSLLAFDAAELTACWQQNVLPAFNAMRCEIDIMRRHGGGRIVNLASITGHIGMKNFAAYGAAKASILNLSKVVAIEHAADGILVNTISPATIDTPMIRRKYGGQLRDYSGVYPTGNCGSTDDVLSVVRMLEQNNFMTGMDIPLDGGLTSLFSI
ncbi:SDR family oxidoreductase [Chromobacterium vaccinii]|uniref:SDR family oxidoreductase n=1 Tax=Chromobacterium vaccinii TaxID=1108595 RepID=A0ABV0FG31_9NEIS